jgi:hypothetical protein
MRALTLAPVSTRSLPLFPLLAGLALSVQLAGCALIAGALPSMQHCDEVSYERVGNRIELSAVCRAPIGGGLP